MFTTFTHKYPSDQLLHGGTLILGHDSSGFVEELADGDYVTVEQSTTFASDAYRLVGEIEVRDVPPDCAWHLSVLVDGALAFGSSYSTPGTYSLDDFGLSVAQQAGAHDFAVRLRFDTASADPVVVELPAVRIHGVDLVEQADPLVLNRFPYPGATGVDATDPLIVELDIASTEATVAIVPATVAVYVNGVIAYDGATATFAAGWDGAGSDATFGVVYNAGATDARIVLVSNGLAFGSEETLTIRVVAEHAGGGTGVDETYAFTTADIIQPHVVGALAVDPVTVHIEFDDDLDWSTVAASAFHFASLTSPAATITAASVSAVTSSVVAVTLDIDMSQGAVYRTKVVGVTDDAGNAVDPAFDELDFNGFTPTAPEGRNFQLWEFVSAGNRRRDESGDLRKWILILQDVVNLLLYSVDRWGEVFDVDTAPEQFVDAILGDLGNPFDFVSMTLIEKRRLGRNLVRIYKTKGTRPGLINAVRFITGIDVTLDVLNDFDGWWSLGESELGESTVLSPGQGDPLWYSFWIDTEVILTHEQHDAIMKIASYMKPAHEHILGLRDGTHEEPEPFPFWVLGEGELGDTTGLGV